ncbi:RNA polymerase sigma factor [Metapseudomonas furukawaii]|uniref:Sigma factor, ECF subfamily n=1 Tax=Metapseudomonas furukawaii TaxID=1149133 RepID=A0AAD1BVA9_METFU|nr:RNA polymerase sigma factor [Pseudomonas furukawaii]ELS25126.1 RNA polymerase sigma-70 factor, ECF subfamily [Pseudomonas furukawaii]BAU71855.1 sigma factor, ECF subfamily [Pseudomonas furukawaii]
MTDSSSPAAPAPAPDASASADPDRREDFLRTFLSRRQQMETLVSRRVGCRATAADLVQDLFLRFWRRPSAPVEDLGTYLLRSAHNLAIDHLRSEGSRNRAESALLPEQQLAEPASPEAALEAGSQLRHVESALRELPERTRQIFLLNRIHGRTYGEIARAMGLTQSAVEKHMMRALEVCKTSLHRADQPSPRPGSAPDES